jgi:DNA-directed RNA polymerase II subunit RPB2
MADEFDEDPVEFGLEDGMGDPFDPDAGMDQGNDHAADDDGHDEGDINDGDDDHDDADDLAYQEATDTVSFDVPARKSATVTDTEDGEDENNGNVDAGVPGEGDDDELEDDPANHNHEDGAAVDSNIPHVHTDATDEPAHGCTSHVAAGAESAPLNLDEFIDSVAAAFEHPLAAASSGKPPGPRLSKTTRQDMLTKWYEWTMKRTQIGKDDPLHPPLQGSLSTCFGADKPDIARHIRTVIKSNIATHGLVRVHLDSFNKFYTDWIPSILKETGPIVVESTKFNRRHVVQFSNIRWGTPSVMEADGTYRAVTPEECIQRGLTYEAPIYMDTTQHVFETDGSHCHVVHTAGKPAGLRPEYVPPTLSSKPPSEIQDMSMQERLAPYGRLLFTHVYRETTLCWIPVMRGSLGDPTRLHSTFQNRECENEPKGDFIITGMSKVIIPQEHPQNNYCRVFVSKPQERYSHEFEVRSLHESKIRSTSMLKGYLLRGAVPKINITVPFLGPTQKPLRIALHPFFRIIGIFTPEAMAQCILGMKPQRPDVVHFVHCLVAPDPATCTLTYDELLVSIGKAGTKETVAKKQSRAVQHIITNEFLPHMGIERTMDTMKKRHLFFGDCLLKMVHVRLGIVPEDNRDHQSDKIWHDDGWILAVQFRQLYRLFERTLTISMFRLIERGVWFDVRQCIIHKRISGSIRYFFTTGKLGASRGPNALAGVCLPNFAFNLWDKFYLLRQINKPINSEGRATGPRRLEPSTWGYKCPITTPEGDSAGLTLVMALLVHIRLGYPSHLILNVISAHHSFQPLLEAAEEIKTRAQAAAAPAVAPPLDMGTPVYLNGAWMGMVRHPAEFVADLKRWKRQGRIPFDVSVMLDPEPVNKIFVDAFPLGVLRPLFVRENMHLFLPILATYGGNLTQLWPQLVGHGVVEYVSAREEAQCLIAMWPYELTSHDSHCEIHPATIFSLEASRLPNSHKNQAPRNFYAACMMHASAPSIPSLTYLQSMPSMATFLHYPQLPMITTQTEDIVSQEQMQNVQNVVLGIVTNVLAIEDGIMMNRAFVERGAFRVTMLKSIREQEKISGTDLESFRAVDKERTKGIQDGDYSKVGEDGFMPVGTKIHFKDIIANKVQHRNDSQVKLGHGADSGAGSAQGEPSRAFDRMTDKAVMSKSRASGVMDRITMTTTADGAVQYRLRIRSVRHPELGDKFATLEAQKGVMTCLVPPEDMPFSESGIVPDMLFGEAGQISRMTQAMITGMMGNKLGALLGGRLDGTNWRPNWVEDVEEALLAEGFDRVGKEPMYSGTTGQEMEVSFFTGIAPYNRMKQMAVDKEQARARGPKCSTTRQPKEGRRQHGGIRVGEMEKDAMIDHGAAFLVKDSLNDRSDSAPFFVCVTDGLICIPPKPNHAGGSSSGATPAASTSRNGAVAAQATMGASATAAASSFAPQALEIVREQVRGNEAVRAAAAMASSVASAASTGRLGASVADAQPSMADEHQRDPRLPWCTTCKSSHNIKLTYLPYACKLLFQELQAMHIQPRLYIEGDDEEDLEVAFDLSQSTSPLSNQEILDLCEERLKRAGL